MTYTLEDHAGAAEVLFERAAGRGGGEVERRQWLAARFGRLFDGTRGAA